MGRDDFAYVVSSLDEIQPEVASQLAQHLSPGETTIKIIVAPHYSSPPPLRDLKGMDRELLYLAKLDHVLVVTAERLLIARLAPPAGVAPVIAIPFERVISLEIASLLLFCWAEWNWESGGRLEKTRVYFNAVRFDLFEEVQSLVRKKLHSHSAPVRQPGLMLEKGLERLPFRFQNYARDLLQLPEEGLALFYQPEILEPYLLFWRHRKAPAWIAILSPHSILLAQDEFQGQRKSYGVIYRFLQRHCLQKVEFLGADSDCQLRLILNLNHAERTYAYVIDCEKKPDVGNIFVS